MDNNKEKWSVPLTCKRCGATGNATFSQDTGALMTSESLAVDNVSGDLKLEKLGRTPDETTFTCLKCGAVSP